MFNISSQQRRDDTDIHSRPSTFVHHAPGGASSMGSLLFGGNNSENAKPRQQNVQQQNKVVKQQQQQVQKAQPRITQRRDDTDIHSRPSTFVHHAPGGESNMHSLIFGHSATDKSSSAPQPKPQQQRQPQQQQGLAGMSNSTRRNDMDTQNRSSTRLHHAPGGSSNMSSLINGGGHAEAVHKTGRKFVNGNVSNQRSAQSTQSSHLAGISNRASSTKLHHPPGGANKNNMHSLIFGGN